MFVIEKYFANFAKSKYTSTKYILNLVIDIGNSRVKYASFEDDTIISSHTEGDNSLRNLLAWVDKYHIDKAILSTVVNLSKEQNDILSKLSFSVHKFSHLSPLPIKILYKTPHTLGLDRIAAVIGAQSYATNRNLFVIDAGSAVTFDFLDSSGNYHGGNISPGLNMRFKSLNEKTAHLPLVSPNGKLPPFGFDTESAIRSGVVRGLIHEINGYISEIDEKHPDVLFFLTGGDEKILINHIKSRIFVDKFLILKGLNRILSNHDI